MIELLKAELHLYRELADLIDKEAGALPKSDLTVFNRLLSEKQQLVRQLQRLERERSDWLAAHGPPGDSPSLKALIASAPQKFADSLENCRRDLAAATRTMERCNHQHRKMLQHCRGLTDDALRLLSRQLYVQPTYQSNGNLAGAGSGGLVLSGLA
ncbi:MAG: flagellar protein FlgN [Desulfosarcinaceae bacterium]|nr:flagellar protein FlgN [Desulfosarcinaceae bacterium]